MIPIVVDLPAPLGPRSAKKSPFSTDKSIPFKAVTSLLYVFLRFLISRAFINASWINNLLRLIFRLLLMGTFFDPSSYLSSLW